MQKIAFTLQLPPVPFVSNVDYPNARNKNISGAITASERLPTCLAGAHDKPAIYRFVIFNGQTIERFYVGETVHFATRMMQYSGMIRRLLLMAQMVPDVVVEKHPMRHVQYFLAKALHSGVRIDLEFDKPMGDLNKKERIKKEGKEQTRFQDAHPK